MRKQKSTDEQATGILQPTIAEKYGMKDGVLPVFACAEFGHVNLTEVKSLEFAEQLAQAGYLIKKV